MNKKKKSKLTPNVISKLFCSDSSQNETKL